MGVLCIILASFYVYLHLHKFFTTFYLQPSIEEVNNYRVLGILGIEFSVTKQFKLFIETEAKHNSRPFLGVDKTDTEYGVRLAYDF